VGLNRAERAQAASEHLYAEVLQHDDYVNSSELPKLKLDFHLSAISLCAMH
jgi:hypothetical protein